MILYFPSMLVYVALLCFSTFALTEDGLILLEMKLALNDTSNALGNWQPSDETPCKWTGISCHQSSQRVVSINLPYTQLRGFISPSIAKLGSLQRLGLHQNSLHGTIPDTISQCSELRAVYLRGNFLQGGIPSNIGNLSHLSILDLSSNSLKGAIPAAIGLLTRLRHLNLSNNLFTGEIPDVGSLSSFGSSSFAGNSDLCGRQVSKPCRTSLGYPVVLPYAGSDKAAGPLRRSSSYFRPLVLALMITLALTLAVLLAFFWICMLSKKERDAKKYTEVKKQVEAELSTRLITFHTDMPYPSCEIIETLESLEEDDIVGCGGYGTVYRMRMNDSGEFAVKRIERVCEGCEDTFERELEILGSIVHRNLVKLRGYCRIQKSKLLIYDYVTMGSLEDCLHGDDGRVLNWDDRLSIALGVARGLSHLHHDCSPTTVHGNMKSSNILLDEDLEAHVSDYGLAKLLSDHDAHVTTVVAGTFGYLAPEYLQSGRATWKSDVYSFGVVLLELVTGKRPTDAAFVKKGLNVVGWMNSMVAENGVEDVVDERCTDSDVETVEAMLEIAAKCTNAEPDGRPTMSDVLQLLEQHIGSPSPSEYDSHSDRC